jgi:hypothetical protein
LASCASIDECRDWAKKAEALASYAKQADDDTLHKFALRIQARAVRRCGELLKKFDARGAHRKNGGATTSSQRQTAKQAGMSRDQQVTAVRVANIPTGKFESAVEGPARTTVTKLAEMGKQSPAWASSPAIRRDRLAVGKGRPRVDEPAKLETHFYALAQEAYDVGSRGCSLLPRPFSGLEQAAMRGRAGARAQLCRR